MFADHQPIISEAGRASPEGWRRVAIFALSTIRCPLEYAAQDTPKNAAGDYQPRSFFGTKIDGAAYLNTHAEQLWSLGEHLVATLDGEALDDALVELALSIPGIGLAKAGFIAQMVYGRSGCIDTHNLTRFGLPLRAFRDIPPTARAATLRRKVRQYNQVVNACGGTAQLWDTWCHYAAKVQPVGIVRDAMAPNYISALHLAAVNKGVN